MQTLLLWVRLYIALEINSPNKNEKRQELFPVCFTDLKFLCMLLQSNLTTGVSMDRSFMNRWSVIQVWLYYILVNSKDNVSNKTTDDKSFNKGNIIINVCRCVDSLWWNAVMFRMISELAYTERWIHLNKQITLSTELPGVGGHALNTLSQLYIYIIFVLIESTLFSGSLRNTNT